MKLETDMVLAFAVICAGVMGYQHVLCEDKIEPEQYVLL